MIPIIILDAIGIENLKRSKIYFNKHIKSSLLKFLKKSENKKTFWYWFSFKTLKKKNYDKNATLLLILTIVLCGITFASRYYFIIYDNYSLSNPWIDDLNKVIQFDSQLWFANELSVNGEFALVNFYSKITDVSPEIALQVIAILESTLLAVIIFWVISKLSPSKFLAPLIASLSFSLVYIITPLNVYDLLKVNPTFAALTFGLPAFVFFLEPSLLKLTKMGCFVTFSLTFTAIGLIDLFTFCILIPPFLIIGIGLTKYKLDNLHILFSFVLSTAIVFGIYYSTSNYLKADFIEFIHANLLSVSSYTYLPQLILPYENIIRYFQFSTFAGLLFIFPLVLTHKGNWRPTAIFFFYFNFLVVLTYINYPWIDGDMINNALVVFIPIIFGLNVAIIIRILNLVLYPFENLNVITISVILISSLFASVFYQKRNINRLTVSDETPKQILDAYDKIGKSFFPYSYCVVNDPAAQVISTNKHFFMNYSFFLEKYAKVDSINTKNRKDPKFLIKNPQFSLSKSVLVFVLNDKSKAENNIFSENKFLNASLIKELELLKKRGRKINLFYESKVLKVYEIVNEPEESKISDLIF
ncbi:hypothetical protein [Flavobacterium psychrotolerans]|uniref:hypothetical protein n=1 Tax=Flavobacterium psychrotolerans TaxID=2169410 RepID=UPI001057C4D4|nr:hypothetical protein [Flavobacterium psychrotolerans]